MFAGTIEKLTSLLGTPFTFMYGTNEEINIQLEKRGKHNAPFLVYQPNPLFTTTYTQSGRTVSVLPMSFLFIEYDNQDSTGIFTSEIQDRMLLEALSFARILDEAKVKFRDTTINIESSSVTLVSHLMDSDMSGVLLEVNVPVDFNIVVCPPKDWDDFNC